MIGDQKWKTTISGISNGKLSHHCMVDMGMGNQELCDYLNAIVAENKRLRTGLERIAGTGGTTWKLRAIARETLEEVWKHE